MAPGSGMLLGMCPSDPAHSGGTLPAAVAGMDGQHGWGVVKFRLLPPLAVLSRGFGMWGDLPVSPPRSRRGHEAGEGSSCGQM